MKEPFFDEIQPLEEIPFLTKTPTNVQLFMFSAVSWNRHRIHYDADFARDHDELPNILVHRGLSGCFLAQMLSEWLGDNGKIKRLEWSNRGSAFPGDTLTCRGKVVKKHRKGDEHIAECEVWIENQKGEVIVRGQTEVIFRR